MSKFLKSFWTMLFIILLVMILCFILWGTSFTCPALFSLGFSFVIFILARKIEMNYWDVIIINIIGIALSIIGIIFVILNFINH